MNQQTIKRKSVHMSLADSNDNGKRPCIAGSSQNKSQILNIQREEEQQQREQQERTKQKELDEVEESDRLIQKELEEAEQRQMDQVHKILRETFKHRNFRNKQLP